MLSWPHEENDIFGIFKVWHANWGWTKYGINSYPFFIWHLECNLYLTSRVQWEVSNKERDFKFCRPQIACRDYSWIETRFYLTDRSTAAASKIFLGLASELWEWKMFFFLGSLTGSISQRWLGQCWPATLQGALGWPNGLRRCIGQPSRPKAYLTPLLAHFNLISLFPLTFHFWKILWSDYELSRSGLSALVCCFSLFCT